MTTHEIVLSHGEEDEFTNCPIWAITEPCNTESGDNQQIWLAGPWFNRPDAEDFLKAKRHRFGETAHVYCLSGGQSWHMKEIYRNAQTGADLLRFAQVQRVAIIPNLDGKWDIEVDRPTGQGDADVEIKGSGATILDALADAWRNLEGPEEPISDV